MKLLYQNNKSPKIIDNITCEKKYSEYNNNYVLVEIKKESLYKAASEKLRIKLDEYYSKNQYEPENTCTCKFVGGGSNQSSVVELIEALF